jgi:hypothetical protein
MSQKLKKLGVGLVAVLALSLVVNSFASAAQFTASKYPALWERSYEASGIGYFETEAGKTVCKHITAQGTLKEASSTLAVQTAYKECTAFGFLATTVDMEGCEYLLHVSSGSGDTYTGTGDLVCPAGKVIKGTAGVCEIQIPAQVGSVSFEFTNDTAKGKISGKATASNVHYTVTKDSFGCPFAGLGTKSNGKIAHEQPVIVGSPEYTVVID